MALIFSVVVAFGAINAVFAAPMYFEEEMNSIIRRTEDVPSAQPDIAEATSSSISRRNQVPGNPDGALGRRRATTISQAVEDNEDQFSRGLLTVAVSGDEIFDERLINTRELGISKELDWA